MGNPLELQAAPAPAVLDAALGLALATGAPLRLSGPLSDADLDLALAAVRLGDPAAVDAARAELQKTSPELLLPHPRPGLHVLELRSPGAVQRALFTFPWPLSLLGKPSELRLQGPNHVQGQPTFHDLRFGWAPLAARLGLRLGLELLEAGFSPGEGEIVASLDPAPALTPLHVVHRGLLRQVGILLAAGRNEAGVEAAQHAAKLLRRQGVIAEPERVPLPVPAASRGRWAITATAEFEHATVSLSELGPPARMAAAENEAEQIGERLAKRLAAFLQRGGAVDAATAERLLLPSFLCAAGLGARAGPPPTCHFTTSEVTAALVETATLARLALPIRAVVSGAPGEEGVIVVAPEKP